MRREDALAALDLLSGVGRCVSGMAEMPGLEQVDMVLLQRIAMSAAYLVARMDAVAQGLPPSRALEAFNEAMARLEEHPEVEKMQ